MNTDNHLENTVTETELLNNGFHRKDKHTLVKTLFDRTYRFVEVTRGNYVYDGEEDETNIQTTERRF